MGSLSGEATRPVRVTASGHDFKFFGPVETALRTGGAVVRRDRWFGHDRHDPARSAALRSWADVVLAEWCLGNAVAASRAVADYQRLVVHFHRFEINREFPAEVDIDRVGLVVFAGPHIRDQAVQCFGWPAERCVWVPNPVDIDAYKTVKDADASRTLGMIGWHRRLKRLDRALDLLQRLRAEDPRWTLRLRGQHPRDTDWVWRHSDERSWFTEQLARISESVELSEAVRFDGSGPVAGWLERIGWILSPSDVESFHLAAAEGMASAAVPVLWPRAGLEEIFPTRWRHADADEAATALLDTSEQERVQQGAAARNFVAERYDVPPIAATWRRLVLGAP